MVDAQDFDVKFTAYNTGLTVAQNITANASGTSYSKEWTNVNVRQQMSNASTFMVKLGGVVSTSIPVGVGNVLGVYYNNGSSTTLSFIGIVTSVMYENYNYLTIEGIDFSYLITKNGSLESNQLVSTENVYVVDKATTLSSLINILNSSKDGTTTFSLPIGTIDSFTFTSEFKIPIMSRAEAFWYLAKHIPDMYFYIDELTGAINARSTRGNSTSVKSYYLTGASTNAYLGKRYFTGYNIYNKVTVVGHTSKNMATYSDYTTKEGTLVSGDTRLYTPFKTTNTTMYLYSTSGMPASGKVILREGTPTGFVSPMFPQVNARITYSGISGNNLTGCSIAPGDISPLGDAIWSTRTPVYMADKIYVDSTSLFDSSGEILIGDEVMSYASKGSNYFQIDASPFNEQRYIFTQTTTTGAITATDTTVPVATTSGWEASGLIVVESETMQYSSKDSTHFYGCSRGDQAAAHSGGSSVIQGFYPELHPAGVLVKQNTDGVVDATNSSIKTNGLYQIIIQEPNVITKEQVEMYASRTLKNYRFGSIFHELYPQDVGGDFDLLYLGDKVQITDASLGLSAVDARVMRMDLTLDRANGVYEFHLFTMPYLTAFTVYTGTISLKDYLSMQRNSRWL